MKPDMPQFKRIHFATVLLLFFVFTPVLQADEWGVSFYGLGQIPDNSLRESTRSRFADDEFVEGSNRYDERPERLYPRMRTESESPYFYNIYPGGDLYYIWEQAIPIRLNLAGKSYSNLYNTKRYYGVDATDAVLLEWNQEEERQYDFSTELYFQVLGKLLHSDSHQGGPSVLISGLNYYYTRPDALSVGFGYSGIHSELQPHQELLVQFNAGLQYFYDFPQFPLTLGGRVYFGSTTGYSMMKSEEIDFAWSEGELIQALYTRADAKISMQRSIAELEIQSRFVPELRLRGGVRYISIEQRYTDLNMITLDLADESFLRWNTTEHLLDTMHYSNDRHESFYEVFLALDVIVSSVDPGRIEIKYKRPGEE